MRPLVSAGVLLVGGGAVAAVVVAVAGGPDRTAVAEGYTQAWARGDSRAMYAQLTPRARRRVTSKRFTALHRDRHRLQTRRRRTRAREFAPGVVRVPSGLQPPGSTFKIITLTGVQLRVRTARG